MPRRTLSQWSASFGEPRDGSCVCVGVCARALWVHHTPHNLTIVRYRRSDWRSPLFWGDEDSPHCRCQSQLHKHSFGEGRNKKNKTKKTKNCSPVTRHLVMTWPLRFKQHTQAHFDRTHSSSLSTHTRTQYSIQCTSPIHTKLRP